jgi:malate dehydrogenase (oxaloacetate-decarboxylating)(NADP+)
LSLAYSPGVAAPVEKLLKILILYLTILLKVILVAVITNGTAILGLGNLGASCF